MLRSTICKTTSRVALPSAQRSLATVSAAGVVPSPTKREGDISDAFVSLSGAKRDPLPDRFRELKCELVRGREQEIKTSWVRLLRALRKENEIIAQKGSNVIPQIQYCDLENGIASLKDEILKRGAVVVRGVVPEAEARAYKQEVEEYVQKNPWTRGLSNTSPLIVVLELLLLFLETLFGLIVNRYILQRFLPTILKFTNYTGQLHSLKLDRIRHFSKSNDSSCHHSGTLNHHHHQFP